METEITGLKNSEKSIRRAHEQALSRALERQGAHSGLTHDSHESGNAVGSSMSISNNSTSGDGGGGDNGGANLRNRVMEQLQALHFDANGKEVDLQVGMNY